ncbi:hypothetical protein OPAG_06823 [Rhodococcus opacus PD630]|nr:hypothetical protein OPAG_06823 [Rhodococcus opacus PD630]
MSEGAHRLTGTARTADEGKQAAACTPFAHVRDQSGNAVSRAQRLYANMNVPTPSQAWGIPAVPAVSGWTDSGSRCRSRLRNRSTGVQGCGRGTGQT